MENQGHPDLFLAYNQKIREGSNGRNYPINYKMEELNKARAAKKSPARKIPWKNKGPGNVGGRTRAIVVDSEDPTSNTWFAGAASGGVWLTTDAGASWQSLTDDLPNLSASVIVQAPSNPDVLYVGTGEGFGNVGSVSGAGIFKTEDRGESWVQLAGTITNDFRFVNRMLVAPDDELQVVAATNTGIFRSLDGGATWVEVYGDDSRIQDLKHKPGNFSIQFAAQNSCCILKSTDAGQTWTTSYETFFNGVERIELATSPANPDWVYAAVQLATDDGGDIYLTTDAGETWTLLQDPLRGGSHNWFGQNGNQGWYDNSIAVHPFSPDTVYIGGIDLWRTNLVGNSTASGGAPTAFNQINTESFLDFVNFTGGSHFGGRVDIGTVTEQLLDVTLEDMTSVEIRFGPGLSQQAHRFSVLSSAGSNGDGGAGIPYVQYIYEDYAEVPFEVWDTDNNEQLMVSFRDQADDGVYNLIARNTVGSRNSQSREYLFIHQIPYDAEIPDPTIAQLGGAAQKAIYFMWPILADNGTWDAANLPASQLALVYSTFEARVREQVSMPKGVESSNDNLHVDHHNITIVPVDAESHLFKIINGNDGGIYYSENSGRSWKDTHNGYVTTQFYDADKRSGSDDYIGGTQDNGAFRSFANPTLDTDWRRIGLKADGFDLFWHPTNINEAIFSFQFNNFFVTTNGGFNSFGQTEGLADIGSLEGNAPFLTSLGWSKDRPDVLYAVGRSGVWRSDDFAANWELAQAISDDQWGFGVVSGCRARVSVANPDFVWAGCQIDAPGGTTTLHLSRNGGMTFSPLPIPTEAEGPATISGLATHPSFASNAYVMFSRRGAAKILHTDDFGETWRDISGFAGSIDGTSSNGFPDVAVHDLLVLPDTPHVLWVATEIGLFISNDSGETWEYADNGIPAVAIWRLRYVDNQVVAATHGRGIWTVSKPFEVANETEEIPAQFELAQNYPNPFNPQTTINFSVPVASDVEIKVYDMSGREVATLADRFFSAGKHQVEWNAQTFASGVYVYRMTVGDFVATQQMTLVK